MTKRIRGGAVASGMTQSLGPGLTLRSPFLGESLDMLVDAAARSAGLLAGASNAAELVAGGGERAWDRERKSHSDPTQ
jgi:hypothetical protein